MKQETILIHTFSSILIAGLLYFYQPFFAKSFFLASLVFNFYLRLLYKGFEAPLTSLQGRLEKPESASPENEIKINPLSILASIFRVVLTAGIIAILIMKFKLNLIAAGAAFFLYQLILIAIGFYYNASYHRRNT